MFLPFFQYLRKKQMVNFKPHENSLHTPPFNFFLFWTPQKDFTKPVKPYRFFLFYNDSLSEYFNCVADPELGSFPVFCFIV